MMFLLAEVGEQSKPTYCLKKHNWYETTISGKRDKPAGVILRRLVGCSYNNNLYYRSKNLTYNK